MRAEDLPAGSPACDDCERTHPWRDHGPIDPDPLYVETDDEPWPPPEPDPTTARRWYLAVLVTVAVVLVVLALVRWR